MGNASKPRILTGCHQSSATLSDLGRANHRLATLIVHRADLVDDASVCKKASGRVDCALDITNSSDVMADCVVIEDVPAIPCSLRRSRFRPQSKVDWLIFHHGLASSNSPGALG